MTAKAHYDNLLGNVYSWMLGSFSERVSEQKEFFARNGLDRGNASIAFDLGAAHGIQSVALAQLGYQVSAVDFNEHLLAELKANSNELPITAFHMDILEFLGTATTPAALVVCMGDTLTHLRDFDQVKLLVQLSAAKLHPGGKFIVSFRDLSQERRGTDRFLLVKADANRSLTCFLEYLDDVVMVHDILIEKNSDGWHQKVSSYPKLRIPAGRVKDTLRENGFVQVSEEVVRGMTYLIGTKI